MTATSTTSPPTLNSRFDSYRFANDVEEVTAPATMASDMPLSTALARIGSHTPDEPNIPSEKDGNGLIDVEKAQSLQDEKDIYARFSLRQKHFIVAVVAFSALLSRKHLGAAANTI